ncbi:Hypothetical predicted protein [Cloeon dipterum]|uniref:Reverse transcriptase RNase H-like domain-containing protein n=1 Tax=Cloeon dipterum TaxID=197152 RepID=A0A8S1E5Y4_9INSE|nr:Hypothetical predicted protein [Cloeon dipterum]
MNCRVQKETESASEFIADLHKIARRWLRCHIRTRGIEELQAYLGLLKKGVKFDFDEKCRKAVDYAKGVMSKKPCLAFYDANLPVVVACDGNRKGIGAVLSHIIHHEEEVEIEALSVVWAVKKFRQFLWGRPFTLVTDHKPLLGIFGRAKKGSMRIYQ